MSQQFTKCQAIVFNNVLFVSFINACRKGSSNISPLDEWLHCTKACHLTRSRLSSNALFKNSAPPALLYNPLCCADHISCSIFGSRFECVKEYFDQIGITPIASRKLAAVNLKPRPVSKSSCFHCARKSLSLKQGALNGSSCPEEILLQV